MWSNGPGNLDRGRVCFWVYLQDQVSAPIG